MNQTLIQKVTDEILYLPEVTSVGIIGDPGCEGMEPII